MYPHSRTPAVPAAPVISTMRVNRTGTSAFGRKAVIVPQIPKPTRSGMVGGALAVGYVWSNTAWMAAAGAVGVVMYGNRVVNRIPNGWR